MRAIVQNGYGSPAEVLSVAEIDQPSIKPDEVLIRVRAAGLDRGTWLFTAGQPYAVRLGLGLRGPSGRVAGMDVAGTVVAAGAAVTRFAVHDDVFGVARGSLAEYAAAKQTTLAHKPARLEFEQAAVIAVSGVTALQGLRDVGRLRAGQHVLVLGASGGVGSYAVQLARAFGAQVTGVCSTEKADFVRSLGAHHVIDYQQADFVGSGQQYDLIVDIGGDNSLSRLRRALAPRGTLVIVGGSVAGKWLGLGRQARAMALSPFVGQRLTTFIAKQRHGDMETLAELVEAAQVAPAVEATYALADTPKAMARLAAGEVRGKIAVSVGLSQTDDRV